MKTLATLSRQHPYKHLLLNKSLSKQSRCCATSSAILDEERKQWKTVVGLEIHAQIASKSKLFSRSGTNFMSAVNSSVALFDVAIPGTLPVLNKRCVEAAVLTSLALDCRLNPVSTFDRKHYFYPDLPAGYQITQQRLPLACDGHVTFPVFVEGKKPYTKTTRLKQLQLEQDSGRTLLDETTGRKLVDLNRAGMPLMELVFEPDLEDGEEAASLVKELCLLFERLGSCACKMEEGNFRVDANVSVHREGEPLGVRTEIKNIGSVRAVASAIKWEVKRQVEILESGRKVVNETRTWDRERGCTAALREKESKQDYRYMPEPNLPPLRLQMTEDECPHPDRVNVPEIKSQIPELPRETRSLLLDKYGLHPQIVEQLLDNQVFLSLFRATMEDKPTRNARSVANILVNPYLTAMNAKKMAIKDSNLTSAALGEIDDLLSSRKIKPTACIYILEKIIDGSELSPEEIVASLNLWVMTDLSAVDAVCESVIASNPKLASVKSEKNIHKLVTLVLNETRSAAGKKMVMNCICKRLGLEGPGDFRQVHPKRKNKK